MAYSRGTGWTQACHPKRPTSPGLQDQASVTPQQFPGGCAAPARELHFADHTPCYRNGTCSRSPWGRTHNRLSMKFMSSHYVKGATVRATHFALVAAAVWLIGSRNVLVKAFAAFSPLLCEVQRAARRVQTALAGGCHPEVHRCCWRRKHR